MNLSDAEHQSRQGMDLDEINTTEQLGSTQGYVEKQKIICGPLKEHHKAQKTYNDQKEQWLENDIEQKSIERGFYSLLRHRSERKEKALIELGRKWGEFGYIFGSSKELQFRTEKISKGIKSVFLLLIKDIAFLWDRYATKPWNALNINIEDWEGITDNGLKSINPYLKCCFADLKALAFSFSQHNEISDFGYQNFMKQICCNLPKLRELSLSFLNVKISDEGVDMIFSVFRENLTHLQKLSLHFNNFCLTDKGVASLASHIKHGLPSLSKLKLNLDSHEGLTEEGLESLANELTHIAWKLTELDLTLNDFSYKEGVDCIIWRVVSKADSLQRLALSLSSWYVIDQLVDDLAITIETNLHKLEHLILRLSQIYLKKVRNKSLACLSTLIENKSLQKLKTFSLDFSCNKSITDGSVIRLVSAIRDNMPQLTKLELDFHGCPLLTEAIIQDSSLWNFRPMTNLEVCAVSFISCEKISQQARNTLASHLSYIKTVRTDYF